MKLGLKERVEISVIWSLYLASKHYEIRGNLKANCLLIAEALPETKMLGQSLGNGCENLPQD